MSELGSCRRRAGYHVQGAPPDEGFTGNTGMQAILGSSIHDALAQAARQSSKVPPGALAENIEVTFAGLTGHPDLYAEPVLRDFKTVGFSMQLDRLRARGPFVRHLWQASTYAAAMILAGYRVTTIQLDYIARDTGDEYLWEGPFEMQHVRDAMAWLQHVRTTPARVLSRDFRPDSIQCLECPFFQRCWQKPATPGRDLRTALFADDPDAAAWVAKLEAARAMKSLAEGEESDAKGALDALRTIDKPGEKQDIEVPGAAKLIRFAVQRGSERLDRETIEQDYARVGAQVPTVRGKPKITVSLVAKPEPDQRGDKDG